MNRFMLKYASTGILKKFICTPHKKLGISKYEKLTIIDFILFYNHTNKEAISLLLNDRKNSMVRLSIIYHCKDRLILEKIARDCTYREIKNDLIRCNVLKHENVALVIAKHPCKFIRCRLSEYCQHISVALYLLDKDSTMILKILNNTFISNRDKLKIISTLDLSSIDNKTVEGVKECEYWINLEESSK